MNIEGFIPKIGENITQTCSASKCGYCGRFIFEREKNRGTYIVNHKPICEDCLMRLCMELGISKKELFKKKYAT